ncbi:MAG: archaemetzincin family Zn-dependent metalloprotease [Candidatus Lokiarchaeota archaeon]|jgi:archaemetzincin
MITKIGDVDLNLLTQLKDALQNFLHDFDILIRISYESMNIKNQEYNSIRDQYNGSLILNRFLNFTKDTGFFRDLGVIDKDIFTDDLNFIFGLAILPRNKLKLSGVALISITRLREEYYNNPANKRLFFTRAFKEVLHELGHTFGLEHCPNDCVMRFSNTLSETDDKPPKFCHSCRKYVSSQLSSYN